MGPHYKCKNNCGTRIIYGFFSYIYIYIAMCGCGCIYKLANLTHMGRYEQSSIDR